MALSQKEEEQIATASTPFLKKVEEKFGPEVLQGLRSTFKKAYAERDDALFKFFLSNKEQPPSIEGVAQAATVDVPDVMDLVAKVLFYAPAEWFEVVTGGLDVEGKQNDFSRIGVAYDASSRLRRLGVEYYHSRLSEKWREGLYRMRVEKERRPLAFYWYAGRQKKAGEAANVEVRSYGAGGDLPEKAPGHVRVVCVADTHMLHEQLGPLPPGDILLHAGDLCYEESRSLDRKNFEQLWAKVRAESGEGEAAAKASSATSNKFLASFTGRDKDFGLVRALKWLGGTQPASGDDYKARLLIGGNHDDVLFQIEQQIGVQTAKDVCASFGKVQFLHPSDGAVSVPLGEGSRPVRVWGSPVSVIAGVANDRAIVSGNTAWRWDPTQQEEFEEAVLRPLKGLRPGDVDIIVTHTPPKAGCLQGKDKRTFACIFDLVERLRPSLYVCGHEHNNQDLFKGRLLDGADFVEGVVGVHAAQTGMWNHAHGLPVVVDLKLRDG